MGKTRRKKLHEALFTYALVAGLEGKASRPSELVGTKPEDGSKDVVRGIHVDFTWKTTSEVSDVSGDDAALIELLSSSHFLVPSSSKSPKREEGRLLHS
eukprot:scaffold42309_cov137-Amphora_coffeaeformis.AAC.1